jgi:outer membrane receptor protein involved in Fe transport
VVNDPLNPGVTTGFANGVQFNYEAIQGVFSWNLRNFLGGNGTLGFNGSALYTILRDFNNLGVQTNRTDGTFGDPSFSAQLNVNYFDKKWGALFSTNFIGKQFATRDGDLSTDVREINERDPYALFNASVFFDVQGDYRFTFSVTNLFDRIYQNDYFGAPNGVADSLGRRFAVSVRARF